MRIQTDQGSQPKGGACERRPLSQNDIATLRAAAASNAGPVAEAILGPRNRRASSARIWRWGRKSGSLWLNITGRHAGRWYDGATGHGGDLLDLVRHTYGFAFLEAAAFLADLTGQPDHSRTQAPAQQPPHHGEKRTADAARRIWTQAEPPAGTMVEAYLTARGIGLPPDAPIRFHPSCPRGARERLPAMVALMTDPLTGDPRGVHRTFLRRDGRGKAHGEAKMMLGPAGVVRLCPGTEPGALLCVAEGVENAIALLMLAQQAPVWACGSAGAVRRLPLVPGVQALRIFDDPDPDGAASADACAARWIEGGVEADIYSPPTAGVDWLDHLVLAGSARA